MIFLFDKFKKLKGTVRNRHTISLLYERERNGLYTVSAEIPLKITDKKTVYNYHKKVKDSDFLGHYDREGRFQLHKIASVDIEDSSIFIKGVHLFFDEAKAGAIIQERRFRQSEIIDGARVAFDSIGWSVVDFDVSDTEDYIFYNVSPLEARAILVETFGFEFDYWLDFDGKNIRNKQISVKREMGKDSNKRYNYGHNVLNIKVEQDYSEIYTAVIGRGKGEDLGDDAYGRRIEFTDVEWKTPSKPMNKPKGSRVLHDENATQLFGYHEDGKVSPRTKVEIFEDIEEPAKLLRASYNWLRENSVPKAVFSLKVPDGDGLDLGDKVHVIYRDIDLVKHTRVTKVVDDLVSGNRDVEFGDTAYFKTDRRLSGVKSELKRVGGSMSSRISRLKAEFDRRFDNEVKQWKDDFEQALIDAEANVEAMRVTMTEEFEAAQKAFEVEFNQSVSDAKKHADAVADAKAEQVQGNLDSFAGRHEQLVGELQGNIVDIDGELADARADVSGILGRLTGVDGSISGIKGSLTEIEGTLTNTKTQLESQITDAKTDLQKQLDDARAELDGLEVGGRNLAFGTAEPQESATTAVRIRYDMNNKALHENVGNKITLSFEAKFDVDKSFSVYIVELPSSYAMNSTPVQGGTTEWKKFTVTSVINAEALENTGSQFTLATTDYAAIRNLKVELGTVATDWTPAPEDTEQKITNINQSITNIEGELSSKVEQTEVDALKGTVERQGTLLTQTSEEVSSKAEKSVVDTLTGRVSNAESSVTQNAEEIAKKLTKSVYDSDKEVTDAKITQWSNLTTETAEGLEQTISRLSTEEGKITKAQADIIANADEIATKVSNSEFDSLSGRVSDNSSSITQNAKEIALKASQTELNSVTGRISTAESQLSVQSGQIALRATKTEVENAIDGIEVGGRNLIPNSNEFSRLLRSDARFIAFEEGQKVEEWNTEEATYVEAETTQANSTILTSVALGTTGLVGVWSIYVKNAGDSSIRVSTNGFSSSVTPVNIAPGEATRVVIPGKARTSYDFVQLYFSNDGILKAYLYGEQLEPGNKVTAYSPAPEDIANRVTVTEASLTVMDDEISSVVGRVSDNETNISSVVQDVKSISSTVATIEGDVASQGSKIEQTSDIIDSKVWLNDVANIGANLIPQSANAWERGGLWIENGGETGVSGSMRMVNKLTIKPSTQYTISDNSAYVSAIRNINIHQYSSTGAHITYRTIPRGGEVTFTTWSNADTIRVSISPMEGLSVLPHFIEHLDGRIKVKLEEGSVATPMVNAISQLQQTADNLAFKVSELTNINGEEILTQSDISIESDRIMIGSQQISSNTLASLISVSPSSIDLITDKMNLTGNLNVKGQIESISTSAVKADFANIFAGTADIQFILAKHLASNTIQARHLYVSNAMAEKLIANTVMAREIKTLSLDAVEANIGSLRTQILTSNVIKSSHIAGGTALIDKIFASNAMFERMMAKSGFVRTLNTVTIDTDQITIRRPDGARLINNGMLQASFDVQIRPNYGGSAVTFGGLNYRTQSSHWQTFEHFYTDFKGSKLLVSWAYSLTDDSASATELGEFRVRGFGSNNPIGTAVSNKWVSKGETGYHNQIIDLGVPDYSTIQAYLEFRRSPNGQSQHNTVNVRVLRVSLIE